MSFFCNVFGTLPIVLCLTALQLRASAAELTHAIPMCTDQQLLGLAPKSDDVKSHRRFDLPKIKYPFETPMPSPGDWGFDLVLRIDEIGRVVCHANRGHFEQPVELNDERRAILAALSTWSYSPFERNGVPVPAIVTEDIYEEELPRQHLTPPTVPLEKVRISLKRGGCWGTCPDYRIELFGDGTAVYEGRGYVDVLGMHRYRIDPEKVAKLLESARSKDLWSLRSAYTARISDDATYAVTIVLGNQVHTISDYVGGFVGMPEVVTEFENEVDEVAQSEAWIHLGQQAVGHLRENHFSFSSREGGEMLLRSIADEGAKDDQAIVELIELGAPWSIKSRSDQNFRRPPGPALEEALANQRDDVVDLLIERGALRYGGVIDQQKLDRAFRAAIRGGRLELVQRIWAAGGALRPSLSYVDVANDSKLTRKRVPVTLLLSHEPYGTKPWAGLEIAKWLTSEGCDIHAHGADGRTLLHIAALAGDTRMTRYVLDYGVAASTPGKFSLPAVAGTADEDVALMLLEAGTDISKMDDGGTQFRRYATYNHWGRVIAWLDNHKGVSP